ncbi:hypothetical protein U9M48_017766 [Paspalum notatum var. saurae]|uniref:Uncharacterized protein n=1 Tax=Paspalum notatum var. saurae TaxID=547442 RepID=A0AAQ3T8H6_PASNO
MCRRCSAGIAPQRRDTDTPQPLASGEAHKPLPRHLCRSRIKEDNGRLERKRKGAGCAWTVRKRGGGVGWATSEGEPERQGGVHRRQEMGRRRLARSAPGPQPGYGGTTRFAQPGGCRCGLLAKGEA